MYSELFTLHASLLKALAHPRRLEIVQLLQEQELPVTDIHTMLDLPQANISQHLSILREAGVVESRKDGKQIYYRMSSPKIVEACDLLREVLIEHHQDSTLAATLRFSMKDLLPITHDPVCHMRVSPKTASFHHHYNGEEYYFCASGCYQKFKQEPETYV
ncbi:metalloregulator ArsR/SmtB family transcription factor [Candidatus Woesebacteria bacterium]|nr:metalloregulator ArsR/SmtB family transcription factor [Candidatus Woesebacteria bacterium]MCD8507751.1 metalloregulator ArsR/SmtB family transcription factor [Candidatus Woesebacteria bacterium]MCD8526641.1 metalloregulator ArsR/SmtB family transcription factor [Candidatus Woesebacteria bacterium]MCD8545891.1 metalloregulator ArsR/SmtB family transcription factor [Candidatus Woesebacteria bacterium]